MRIAPLLLLGSLALLASCGNRHPLDGTWHADAAGGISMNFDDKSDKFLGHGAGSDHASHDHLRGTYLLQGSALELQGTWDGTGEKVHWKGRIREDGKLEFRPADKPDFQPALFHRH
ncbi:MAG: hypothetical protein RL148_1201 [Planctomycetota bacterium]|jgi:hypothetical protein